MADPRASERYFAWHQQPGYWRDITRHFAPGARLLDVGCGTAWLADHFQHYTGIDPSPGAVALAHRRGVAVQQMSADEPLAFADASFDAVVLKDVLEHVRDPIFTVGEALRVLEKGGQVFASSPDAQRWVWDDYTHRRPFTRKAYRGLFADQGFDVERCGYESVQPGVGLISARTKSNRRPALIRASAWVPAVRRNVWILARKPGRGVIDDPRQHCHED